MESGLEVVGIRQLLIALHGSVVVRRESEGVLQQEPSSQACL